MLARQAVLVVLSQGVSNDANNHMSYPTKLLFKASKLVPIMLVGRFVFRRRYHALEWLATLLLVGGLYTVVIADVGGGELQVTETGYRIIGVSLLGDAFIGFLQEHTMRTMRVRLSGMMAGVYSLASVLVLVAIAADGRAGEYLRLLCGRPEDLLKPLVYGWLSYIGNCFVQTMIGNYGVLLTVSCLNVRQFSTIMASYHGFGRLRPKPFGLPQQLGTALVFAGILVKWAHNVWVLRARPQRAKAD